MTKREIKDRELKELAFATAVITVFVRPTMIRHIANTFSDALKAATHDAR